jgi:dTDP-4-amino-4,6-dideoxygalactose transaminase
MRSRMKSELAPLGGEIRSKGVPALRPPAPGRRREEGSPEGLDSGWITTGPKAFEFEEKIAAYAGAALAISLPLYPRMGNRDAENVRDAARKIVVHYRK